MEDPLHEPAVLFDYRRSSCCSNRCCGAGGVPVIFDGHAILAANEKVKRRDLPIPKDDILALELVKQGTDDLLYRISYACLRDSSSSHPHRVHSRHIRTVLVRFEDAAEVTKWESGLRRDSPRVLIVINPVSGTGSAPRIFRRVVRPLFERFGISFHMEETTHAGHARQIAADAAQRYQLGPRIRDHDLILVLGGDGTMFEVVNGILAHGTDSADMRIPLCAVPGGSGNALTVSIGAADAQTAAVNALTKPALPLDTMEVRSSVETRRSFLSVSFGLAADVDLNSEHLRWMGETRFTYILLKRIFSRTKYRARILFVPVSPEEARAHGATAEGEGKFSLEQEFSMVFINNTTWVNSNLKIAPHAAPADGAFDLSWVNASISRLEVIRLLTAVEKGKQIHRKTWHTLKVTECEIESLVGDSLSPSMRKRCDFSVDGERLRDNFVHVRIIPSSLTVVGCDLYV